MFADGTELGWAHTGLTSRFLSTCGPVQSSSGAVFQWSAKVDSRTEGGIWRERNKGFLTGAMANGTGTWFARILYMDSAPQNPNDDPAIPFLCWTKDASKAKGFFAKPVPGNRVALCAYDSQFIDRGMRPYPYKRELDGGNFAGQYDIIGVNESRMLPLDCQFVKVQRLFLWIHGNEGEDPSGK